MSKNAGCIDIYFRFLNLARAIEELPSVPRLDAAEQKLLEIVTSAWHSGNALSVTEAMALDTAGAPATIHRRLTRLREKGLIELRSECEDLRVKSVVPTEVAQSYFRQIARCMQQAIGS